MVLIMSNMNYLVILFCSTVFLLSSFVSSQQKRKPIEDPLEFYKRAVYDSIHFPAYYAANYQKISEEYKRIQYKSNERRNTFNNEKLKSGISLNNAGMKAIMSVPRISKSFRNNTMVNDYRLIRKIETQPRSTKFSRSLSSIESPYMQDVKESPVAEKRETKVDQEWNQHCYMLGYNNTNDVCQSDPSEEIKLALNKEDCRKYIQIGCQYRSDLDFCNTGFIKVLQNITFDCRDINIKSDNAMMSFQCCMSCKGGINTATSADTCDMHVDSSLPSLAQEYCCSKFLKSKVDESATESITTSEKPMDAVIAMLDERLSNSSVNKPETDSTISTTSVSPTTTTTETPNTATLSTTTQAVTTPTTETPVPTTTTTTTELTTTTSTTTAPSTTSTNPTTATLPTTANETIPSTSALRTRNAQYITSFSGDYQPVENENNLFRKVDVNDESKADYLVILDSELKFERDEYYKNYKLMNLTVGADIKCDWKFNFESSIITGNEYDGIPLKEDSFLGKQEGSSYILYLSGRIAPQFVEFSVECDIQKYKFYKYQVSLVFRRP